MYPEHDNESENKKPVILEEAKPLEPQIKEENILDDERGKNTWIWVLSSIFIFIVLIMIGIFIVYPKLTEVPDVIIPNVSGMTIQKAEETLKDKGFEVAIQIEQVSDEKIAAGLVVKTSPSIGRKVKKGTNVTLYESLGNTVYEIEDYTGKNYIEVKTILTSKYNLNVIVEKIDVDSDKEYDKQEIIKQDLSVGTKVSKGSKIILYIPNVVDEYPNFVDEQWTIEEIQNFCDEYGVVVTFVPKQSEEYPENTIISQSRAAETTIVKGATLKIVYAVKYEETVEEENEKDETNEETNEESNTQE